MGLDGSALSSYINSKGGGAVYMDDYRKACEYIQYDAKEKDVVLVLGAGSVNTLGAMLTQ